jgi:hypothetical protein
MGGRDIDRPAGGELMDREDDNMPTVGGIFSRLWRFPFLNLRQQKKLTSVRKVVQEEEGLWKDLVTHRQSFNRLRNIDHILAEDNATLKANALAAQNRLAEEERKEKARKTDDRIFAENKRYEGAQSRMRNKYELKIQEAEYKKRLHPLEREVEDLQNPPPVPEPAAQPNKQKLREDAYKRFDKEVKRIDKMKNVTAERKTDLKNSARSDLEKELEKIDRMP